MKDFKAPLIILLVLFILVGLAFNSPIKNFSTNQGSSSGNSQEVVSSSISASNQNSPYYSKIKMSGISGLNNADPSTEYITLYTNLDKNETVKITGWYLKSDVTGYYAVIGGAALLPVPPSNAQSDVMLRQGDTVYLVKGFSPIGASFRTNKCTGYFEENRTFTPYLPMTCPLPKNEKLPQFSSNYDMNDECIKIIENLPECGTVDNKFIRDLPDTVPQTCKDYLTTQINYNSCVALHFSDADFPGNKYYIYLNKLNSLWRPLHDIVKLYDSNGLVVDSLSYSY
jgi:hypothetical protein